MAQATSFGSEMENGDETRFTTSQNQLQTQVGDLGEPAVPATPSRRHFAVYDDSVPASMQPQTPQNLPEARHRGRIHGPFTAPSQGQTRRVPSQPTLLRSHRLAQAASPVEPDGFARDG